MSRQPDLIPIIFWLVNAAIKGKPVSKDLMQIGIKLAGFDRDALFLTGKNNELKPAPLLTRRDWDIAHCAATLPLSTPLEKMWIERSLPERCWPIREDADYPKGDTKTDAGNRVIPLNQDTVLALSDLLVRAE